MYLALFYYCLYNYAMKTIVTHFAPDVDAITSVWLLSRFLPGWDKAVVRFVSAGNTLNNEPPESDPEIMHVDTGMGRLDHHQTDEDTCAAKRTFQFVSQQTQNSKLRSQNQKGKIHNFHIEALERMIDVVNDIDHFREVYFPNPAADFYDFGLVAIMDGWKLIYNGLDEKIIELGMLVLDGIYKTFQDKLWAEKEISTEGIEFQSKWGKAIGIETLNDEVIRLAQKMGFVVVVRKDPKKDYVRIKALPESKVDLTSCYNIYREKDKEATWFLHAGKKMLLNGSMKNPECRPTKLTLREIVNVLKK